MTSFKTDETKPTEGKTPVSVNETTPIAYRVLYADPPWAFSDQLPGETRGASRQYRCLTVEDLKRFPLPPLASPAILFLWRVSSMIEEALAVGRAWGFVPKAEIVWDESCLIFTRGKGASLLVRDHSIRSRFAAPVPVDEKTGKYKHSAKPEEFRDLVERMCPGPYVELFGRRPREGWLVLGDEVAPPAGERSVLPCPEST